MPKRILILLALVASLMTGCVDGVQSILNPLGPVAERQMSTFMVTLWVSLGIFAVVGTFLVYCLVKFHHKGEVKPGEDLPEQGHGSALLEIALILISVGLVGVIALPSLQGVFWVGTVPENEEVYEVNVTGLQWWWKFEYPALGVETANEIAIPAGRPVKFNVRTADVLHSFWVPRLGGKMDLNPGQDNWLWLEADPELLAKHKDDLHTSSERFKHLGEDFPFEGYVLYGQCAEFCGESHAFMKFRVLVLDEDNFRKWVEWQKSDQKSTLAKDDFKAKHRLFMRNKCGSCHYVRGTSARGLVGPDLTHIGTRTSIAAGWLENTHENLEDWIQRPNYWKPGNVMFKSGYKHNDEDGVEVNNYKIEVDDATKKELAEYLRSLR